MLKLTPFKIVLIYVLLGVAWITGSDMLAESITRDPRTLTFLNIAHLTKQLLTFSKGAEPVKRMVALPVLVQQAAKFALCGSNVSCRSSRDEGLWTVEADEGQLNQVIHNIVLNACESMPGGGTVGLDMRNVTITEKNGAPLGPATYGSASPIPAQASPNSTSRRSSIPTSLPSNGGAGSVWQRPIPSSGSTEG